MFVFVLFIKIKLNRNIFCLPCLQVTIVCQILSLASSASETTIPLFSRETVELAVRTVVDGFLEPYDIFSVLLLCIFWFHSFIAWDKFLNSSRENLMVFWSRMTFSVLVLCIVWFHSFITWDKLLNSSREHYQTSEGVVDKINIFRSDRVFMVIPCSHVVKYFRYFGLFKME